MPSEDNHPDFLPGDLNPPPDKLFVREPAKPPPPRRFPVPLLVLGGVLVLALLVGGFIFLRVQLGDPSTRGPARPGDPLTTLTPRSGTPAPLQTAVVGERVQVEGLYGKGTVMVVRSEWSDQGDLAPSHGRQYLNLEVRYDVAEGSMFVHPNFYAVWDSAKIEYYPGIGSGKVQLGQQEIRAGRSVTGWVSIELPPGQSFFLISDEGINPLVLVEIPAP